MPVASFLTRSDVGRLSAPAASGGLLGSARRAESEPSAQLPSPPPVEVDEGHGIALEDSLLEDACDEPEPRSPTMADDGREEYLLDSEPGHEPGQLSAVSEGALEATLRDSRVDEERGPDAYNRSDPNERGMVRPARPSQPLGHSGTLAHAQALALAYARGGQGAGSVEAEEEVLGALQSLRLFPYRPPADLAQMNKSGRLRETASLRPSDISYLADHADAERGRNNGVSSAELFFSISVPGDTFGPTSQFPPVQRLVSALGGAEGVRRTIGGNGGHFGELGGAHPWLRELLREAEEPRPPGRADALRLGAQLDEAMLEVELRVRELAADPDLRKKGNFTDPTGE
ncbi:hypothetical protein T492DRAFT_415874 [Pavlovales sp. CCMP2436]|nr:hypothetical protein T492DRAFT_415874 [Pavlovales sp. CCMP2436]